jgi:hypothetical protein
VIHSLALFFEDHCRGKIEKQVSGINRPGALDAITRTFTV